MTTGMEVLFLSTLSLFVVGLIYGSAIRVDINAADEGYLFLGADLTMSGQTPIRDFRAYDPGRYYWAAMWLLLLGSRLFSLRASQAVLMVLALSCAGVVVSTAAPLPIAVIHILATFIWMKPIHKSFEQFFSIAAVAFAYVVLMNPLPEVIFSYGVFLGITLFFGLNIALYAIVGAVGVFIFLLNSSSQGFVAIQFVYFVFGGAVGLLPVLAICLSKPGYVQAYFRRKIKPIIKRRSTNLAVTMPWRRGSAFWALKYPSRVFFFMIIFGAPLFYIGLIIYFMTSPPQTAAEYLALAAALSGPVYLHHFYSRADLSHLMQTMQPALLALTGALVTFLAPAAAIVFGVIFLVCSIVALGPAVEPLWVYLKDKEKFQSFDTGNERLQLPRNKIRDLAAIQSILDKYSSPGSPGFFAPTTPLYYQLFDRPAAVYDTFCVYPADNDAQLEMIEQLKQSNPAVAVIQDVALDGRNDLRFCNTYPRVWKFIEEGYNRVTPNRLTPSTIAFVLKSFDLQK